jgi:hypothetical protein
MNDATTASDQGDEEILTHDVSDEALEAAAGTAREGHTFNPLDPLGPC